MIAILWLNPHLGMAAQWFSTWTSCLVFSLPLFCQQLNFYHSFWLRTSIISSEAPPCFLEDVLYKCETATYQIKNNRHSKLWVSSAYVSRFNCPDFTKPGSEWVPQDQNAFKAMLHGNCKASPCHNDLKFVFQFSFSISKHKAWISVKPTS